MLRTMKNGQTSVVLRVKILDSSVSTGAGLTGLTSASAGLIIGTIASNEATSTAYTVTGSTIETITTIGTYAAPTATKCRFKEVDSTNHKGVYELQFADARFAVAGARSLLVSLSGAANMAQADFVVQLQADDPNVAKPANSELLSIDANGRVDVIKIAGATQAAPGAAGGLLISGSNAGTTTLGALTVTGATTHTGATVHTGAVTMAAGLAITNSTTNGVGLSVAGNGIGSGFRATGGTNGTGISANGGSSTGSGLRLTSNDGHGLDAAGGGPEGSGIFASAAGTNSAMFLYATGTGAGLFVNSEFGPGFHSQSANSNGLLIVGGTDSDTPAVSITANGIGNSGVRVLSSEDGHGLEIQGGFGGTEGDGVRIESTATNGNGINAIGSGTGGDIVGDIAYLAGTVATVAKLDTTVMLASGSPGEYKFTADALEDAPTGTGGGGGGLDAAGVRAAVGLAAADLDAQLTALPTNAELATALGTADDAVLAQVALVKAKTDLIPASPAAVGDVPTALEIADAYLNRDMAAVSDTNSRSPLNALRFIRNKWWLVGTDLTVTKEDDLTEAWTAVVTATPGADPITGNDPAG